MDRRKRGSGGVVCGALLLIFFLLMVPGAINVAEAEGEVPSGAWLDEIVAVEEASTAAAITQLELGDFGIYAETITEVDIYDQILDSEEIQYVESFGSYNELTFNPYGPEFETGELNPFSEPRVREAMNFLIDRNYVAEEIYGGMAVPKFFPIGTAFPDYADLVVKARELEAKYAYDPVLGEEIIEEVMIELGADRENGSWYYNGEPVELTVLTRTEDEREELGDYVASIMEDIGFEVERRYVTAAEASPIWMTGDPAAGEWSIYTGGWITTVVDRDQSDNFDFFYTPRGLATPLYHAMEPTEEFDEVADRLSSRDFTTVEERQELFERALELCMEDGVRLWLVDNLSANPYRTDVEVAADMAGGISGSYLWAQTARYVDEVGGEMTVGMPSVLPEPWNPLDGSNWIFDMMLIRATGELGYMWDPYTGLHHPNRVERAEVYIKEGLPVTSTLDWVDLKFVEENRVPEDAWYGWDAEEQKFITVGDAHPDGVTANRRTRVYYPEDFFDNVSWHDGSPFSVGDILFGFILNFDRAKEESPFFDAAQVPDYESFREEFQGMKIVQEDPLIIDYYTNLYYLDAEWYVYTGFPYYAQGPGAWHNLALGYLAEVDEELAFSAHKADELEVEHMNMIAGPSLSILEEKLDRAQEESFVPYEAALGEFISDEEAEERWSNLRDWFEERDHFWLGTGPFYLKSAHPVEGIVHLARFEDHPDPADRWEIFAEPMIPEIDVESPGAISIGDETTVDMNITFEGEPYPSEELDEVRYLIFDARGNLVHAGEATEVEEGLWQAEISAEVSEKLVPGTNRFEAIAVSKLLARPIFSELEFVSFE